MKVLKVVIFIIALIVFGIVVINMTKTDVEVIGTKEYIVAEGDTLCTIAQEQGDDSVDKENYIYYMMLYNKNIIPCLQTGQKITFPILQIRNKGLKIKNVAEASESKYSIKYTSLGVPQIDSSFKTWMSYKAVTSKNSPQYKLIHTYGWSDCEGFMRANAERDFGINDDYYLVALGSYYGTEIGTKYRITLDTGKVFYGVLADCKANRHTNATNQYVSVNGNVVEFIVDTARLNKSVRKMGNANVYSPLNGKVCKIEKMDFVVE